MKASLERDKLVTRQVHRLFIEGFLKYPRYVIPTMVLHPPFFFFVNIFVPMQVAYGIQAIITGQYGQVTHYAWVILIVMLITQTFFAFATLCFDRAGAYGGAYVQNKVFENYLSKDYDFYSSHYVGALGAQAARLRDAFEDYGRIFLFDIPKAAVIVLSGIAVIAFSSLDLALLTAGFVLGLTIFNVYVAKFRLKYRRMLSQSSSKLAGKIGDSLSHGATVKSFAKEDYEYKLLQPPLKDWRRIQLRVWDSSIPHTFARHVFLALTMAALLIVSAHLYREGTISIAIVALIQLYLVRIVTTTLDISEIIKKYEALMGAAYEPVATMMVPATIKDPTQSVSLKGALAYDIEFQKVSFRYPEAAKGVNAIDKLSLSVKSGEKLGLVGYSGGGKTTLTKLLLRFMDVTEGEIVINGVDIRKLKQKELRDLISYVPQEPLLFHRSIRDNILYSRPGASLDELAHVAKLAHVDEFASVLPAHYDTMVGERGVKLSGGQRQRVAIARALLKDSPVLVLDEATSALDSASERYIQKALWELMEGRTAIVIAHRLSTIQKMDRIAVVDKGKVIEIGSHEELLKIKNGKYADLWRHQSGGYLPES